MITTVITCDQCKTPIKSAWDVYKLLHSCLIPDKLKFEFCSQECMDRFLEQHPRIAFPFTPPPELHQMATDLNSISSSDLWSGPDIHDAERSAAVKAAQARLIQIADFLEREPET